MVANYILEVFRNSLNAARMTRLFPLPSGPQTTNGSQFYTHGEMMAISRCNPTVRIIGGSSLSTKSANDKVSFITESG